MNVVFSKEGAKALRLAWALLGVAIVAAAAIAWASHWYVQKERRDNAASNRELAEAQARVAAARKERDDLQASSQIFMDLVKRGVLKGEGRLDFIERLQQLKARHQLLALEYEIAPQRPLPLAGGRVFESVDVLGSRVKVRALALHEGEALAFTEELTHAPRGFYPAGRCTMKRLEAGSADAIVPRAEVECVLEWVTLKDKRGNRAS